MKILKTYEEYKTIIKKFRNVCKRPFSNVYYMQDDINRYISLERMYYDEFDFGLIFYIDEEIYYKICLYVDPECDIHIPSMKKKMVIKNIYKREKKDEATIKIEEQLRKNGFVYAGASVGIRAQVSMVLNRCTNVSKYEEGLIKKGYEFVIAEPKEYEQMERIIVDSKIVKDYQLDYRTKSEREQLEPGSYLYIRNAQGDICAVSVCTIENGIAYGVAMAVKEQYKMLGLAPVLTNHRFEWLEEKDIAYIYGWILTDNEASIRYHKSLGYEFTDKYTDEWVK